MLRLKRIPCFALFLGALAVSASSTQARDIGGTISTTLTITEDSQLVDDVTCTVTGAACIAFGAPNIKLELNGFTMTGQADPLTGCSGGGGSGEHGILVDASNNPVNNVTIRGPGLVQRFRNHGINLNVSNGNTVTGVTTSTNCSSGIIVITGSDNLLENNVSIQSGRLTAPCGGI